MVEPHSSSFRVITTNILGVRIFRKFTVNLDHLATSCLQQPQSSNVTYWATTCPIRPMTIKQKYIFTLQKQKATISKSFFILFYFVQNILISSYQILLSPLKLYRSQGKNFRPAKLKLVCSYAWDMKYNVIMNIASIERPLFVRPKSGL